MAIPVEVYKQGRSLGRFKTRDIDMEGAFIEMSADTLKPNDIVELRFLYLNREHCDHTLSAGVVRFDANGIGLILLDNNDRALTVIRHALSRVQYDVKAL
jgi:hypothetical protein